MANVTISPNMNLPIPVTGVDPGPDWANNIVACLNIIDEHQHVALTSGVPVTPSGINITADLPFNSNNATLLRSARFAAQTSPLALGSDIDCLYVSGVDLYYNDGGGNQVRITQSGSVTGATGTITGLPSGSASASFSGGTFTFQKSTNTPATMSVGRVLVGQEVVSGFGVTLTANASQASNYGFTFPAALPGSANYTTLDSSGNLAYNSAGATGSGAVALATTPAFANGISVTNASAGSNAVLSLIATNGVTTNTWFLGARGDTSGVPVTFSNANGSCVMELTSNATSWVSISDRRVKEDIFPLEPSLGKIRALRPCSFKFTKTGKYDTGFIAQEVKQIIPSAVLGEERDWTGEKDEYGNYIGAMKLSKEALIPFLVKAIQELAQQVAELRR